MSTIPAKISGSANSANIAGANGAASEDTADQSLVWALYDAVPAWGISLLLHACIFLLLLTVTLPEILLPELNLTSSIEQEEVQAEEYVIDSEPTEQLGSMSNLNIQGASAAIAQSKGLDNHREEIRRIESAIVNPKIETFEALTMPSEAETIENIDLTGTTEHPGGTEAP